MLFTGYVFWGFFAAVFALYWALPHRLRWPLLLAADLAFYLITGGVRLAFALAVPVLLSWGVGLALPRVHGAARRLLLAAGLAGSLSFLIFYKYAGFLCGLAGLAIAGPLQKLALPLGISYYSLQTVSYLSDIYHGRLQPEKHLGYYSVSVTFFPLMLTGPIERPAALLPELRRPRVFDEPRARSGVVLVVFGLFEKLSVANILGSFADAGFDRPSAVTGVSLLICAVLYSLQIYCDFAGYSNIARGAALLLGLEVTQNFRQPYFSQSFREFWGRWHISLSTWLRDYIYIPLGGSRRGRLRTYLNLMLTFLVSGLWHGANLCFVAWGGLHGLYQCAGRLTAPARRRLRTLLHVRETGPVQHALRTLFVFVLAAFAWIFFRVGSSTSTEAPAALSTVFALLRKMAADFTLRPQAWKDALVLLNFNVLYLVRTALLLGIVFAADWKSRRSSLEDYALTLKPGVLLAFGWVLCLCILFFGVDTGAPIYFKF